MLLLCCLRCSSFIFGPCHVLFPSKRPRIIYGSQELQIFCSVPPTKIQCEAWKGHTSSEFTDYQGFSLSQERTDCKPKIFVKNIVFTTFFFWPTFCLLFRWRATFKVKITLNATSMTFSTLRSTSHSLTHLWSH